MTWTRGLSIALLALSTAACGNRLPHDEVVAAATPTAAISGDALAGEVTESGLGSAEQGTAGGEAVAGSSTGAGATGGQGSTTAGAGSAGRATGSAGSGAATAGKTSAASVGSAAGPGSTPGAARPGAATASGQPVVIGHVGTYSGVLGAIFKGGKEMAQLWARSVNGRGGLNGRPVKMIVADDGADPAKNAAIVKDMVENQGAIAFVGNIVPLSLSGSKAYLEGKKIPAVGGDGATKAWWESPVLFPQGTFIDDVIAGGAEIPVKAGFKRLGVLYCGEAAACTAAKKVIVDDGRAQRAGGQIVYQAQVSLAQPDFTAECLAAQNAKVEALVAIMDGNALSRVARSCTQQGFKPQYVTFGLAMVNELEKDPNLEGAFGSTSTFPWPASNAATKEYSDALAAAPGVPKSGATATVWGAGKLLEAAVKKVPGDVTSQSILEGLWSLKDETLGGLSVPLNFPKGQASSRPRCYWVMQIKGGKWTAPEGLNLRCP